jgi:hypothetical protein
VLSPAEHRRDAPPAATDRRGGPAAVADIGGNPRMRRLTAAALARGVIVVGDGATMPELTSRLAANLRVPVRPACSPRLAALGRDQVLLGWFEGD